MAAASLALQNKHVQRSLNKPKHDASLISPPHSRALGSSFDCIVTMTPFFPSIVWYIFSSLQSWTRFNPYLPSSSPSPFPHLRIARPSTFHYNYVAHDKILNNFHSVYISVCNHTLSDNGFYQWNFFDSDHSRLATFSSTDCKIKWKAPFEGAFRVIVKYYARNKLMYETSRDLLIKDFWMISVGDSFSSGEGNPQYNEKEGAWLFNRCHNSRLSFAYKIYEKLKAMALEGMAVHLTFFPCSGALIEDGSFSLSFQLEVIRKLMVSLKHTPDLVLMTAGGNDIGYSDMLQRLLSGRCPVPDNLPLRLLYLSSQFDQLGKLIETLGLPKTFVIKYFDFTTNERGRVDSSCQDLHNVSLNALKQAQKVILKNLNRVIDDKSRFFGWTPVDLKKTFRKHGICSKRSLIRTLRDSYRLQGDYGGSFHPTEQAHQLIADLILSKFKFSEYFAGV